MLCLKYGNRLHKSDQKFLEPKLAYHGFKFSEEKSHPYLGSYWFARDYWGKSQYISVGRVEYELEDIANLTAERDDIPTEVPREFLLIQEPDYRLWLSNRYLEVVIGHESAGRNIWQDRSKDKGYRWEFHNEVELTRALQNILEIILSEGLEWFDEQVADIRRHHVKLDRRRQLEPEKDNDNPSHFPPSIFSIPFM